MGDGADGLAVGVPSEDDAALVEVVSQEIGSGGSAPFTDATRAPQAQASTLTSADDLMEELGRIRDEGCGYNLAENPNRPHAPSLPPCSTTSVTS
ncbi:hypothetical protein QRX50_35505 [Amycolatopsis carbonis]|uniref:Uncharacterized protein n=1 Tax=Amycolatopsis carbonis TaxID=715471 RepID=A0A9Y2MTC6_9PSEU|nr:hypothetical protein [Amycolatopsis sp. 2-15]WIX76718.1 hypothetical protein QRX50_35505 [Amycolatopsis sp. 2-15]